MFDFLKSLGSPVVPDDRHFVEENYLWFAESIGFDSEIAFRTREAYPVIDTYSVNYFQALFFRLCEDTGHNPEQLTVMTFDEATKRWTEWTHEVIETNSHIRPRSTNEIRLVEEDIETAARCIAALSRELWRHRLDSEGLMQDDPELHPSFYTLIAIFNGYGIFIANAFEESYGESFGLGEIHEDVLAYACAFRCYMTRSGESEFISGCRRASIVETFKASLAYLEQNGSAIVTAEKLERARTIAALCREERIAERNKDYRKMIELADRFLELEPKHPDHWNNRGYYRAFLGEYEEAIKDLTKALELDPHFDYAYNNRGFCKLRLGRLKEAFEDVFLASNLNPDNPYAWRNLGACYLAEGNAEEARRFIWKAYEMNPEVELIHYYLGLVYLAFGNKTEARKAFERSRELNETTVETYPEIG